MTTYRRTRLALATALWLGLWANLAAAQDTTATATLLKVLGEAVDGYRTGQPVYVVAAFRSPSVHHVSESRSGRSLLHPECDRQVRHPLLPALVGRRLRRLAAQGVCAGILRGGAFGLREVALRARARPTLGTADRIGAAGTRGSGRSIRGTGASTGGSRSTSGALRLVPRSTGARRPPRRRSAPRDCRLARPCGLAVARLSRCRRGRCGRRPQPPSSAGPATAPWSGPRCPSFRHL